MRDTDSESAVGSGAPGRVDHRGAGMLLENVPDHLDHPDVGLALAQLDGFVEPADGWTKGRAPDADLALAFEVAQRTPELRIAHVLHLHVVNLQHVDVVGLETLQAAIDGQPEIRWIGAHRQLGLAATGRPRLRVVDVIADLRGVDHLRTATGNCGRNLSLRAAVAVRIGRVEERDAVIVERAAMERDGVGIRHLTPPSSRGGPVAESHLADRDLGPGERPITHATPSRGEAGARQMWQSKSG